MIKKVKSSIKKKFKKDEQRSSLLTVIIVFYLFLSFFMMIIGNISFLKISSHFINNNISNEIGLLFYDASVLIVGILLLIGSISGAVGIIKLDLNWLLYAIITLIVGTYLFVLMDGYFSAIYGLFSYINYAINIISLICGTLLLIIGYNKQKKML